MLKIISQVMKGRNPLNDEWTIMTGENSYWINFGTLYEALEALPIIQRNLHTRYKYSLTNTPELSIKHISELTTDVIQTLS
jgi:hypothetical protein